MKNNLAKDTTGCAFRVEECILECGIETSRVVWEQTPVTITATEALALNAEDVQVPKSEVAADFLRDLLSRGSVAASRVREEVDAAGLSWATVRRAADEIGVQRHETGFGEGGEWAWTLCRPLGAI